MAKPQRSLSRSSPMAAPAAAMHVAATPAGAAGRRQTTPPWRLQPFEAWHLLSLDAPCVATLWVWFTARRFGAALPATLPWAMFLAVWALYAADRLLDARAVRRAQASSESNRLEPRHLFHDRHRRAFTIAVAAASLAALPLAASFSPRLLLAYAALGTLLLAWLAAVHLAPRPVARRLPKEFAVGLFFALAIFAPAAQAAGPARAGAAALGFAALCTLNCLFIRTWEHIGRRRAPWMVTSALVLTLGACALALREPRAREVLSAIALSSALLLLLDRIRGLLTATTLRAAADLVLLTPLLWLWR